MSRLAVRSAKYSPLVAAFVVAAVAASGYFMVRGSHAAGVSFAFEAESGLLSTGANRVTDSAASGGAAVKFTGAASPTPAPTPTPAATSLSNFFPIGVYVPPAYDFDKWKARGINTVVGVPDGNDLEAWNTQANTSGLYMLREPRTNIATDKTETLLLGYMQPDEPDGIYSQVPYTTIQSTYNSWKTAYPAMPVYINLIGGLNQYDLKTGESGDTWYAKYVAGADWISADTYPINNGMPITAIGAMVDHLRALAGSKPVFAFIEASDYDTTNAYPGPTAAQVRSEMWSAIIHGARGLWFFPEQITPSFLFDAAPATVVTEITKQAGIITALASTLQGPINPTGLSATVASPLEAAWRSSASGKYIFVLNNSNTTRSAQTITLSGVTASTATVYGESRSVAVTNGKVTDDFAPYAVHIYQLP